MDCLKCGACCRWLILKQPFDIGETTLLHMRGAVFLKNNTVGVFLRCKHLQDNNLCDVYPNCPAAELNRNFPAGCELCELCREADTTLSPPR